MSSRQAGLNTDLRIAIIGAGVSGLMVAQTLRDLGYRKVTIFEKQKAVGGKVMTLDYRGRPYETGALVANHNFRTVLTLAAKHGQSMRAIIKPQLIDNQGRRLSEQEFVRKYIGLWSLLRSSARFFAVDRRYGASAKLGFAHTHPALFQPMKDFLVEHDLVDAGHAIKAFLTGCGYGYYDTTPAIYLMKLAPWVLGQRYANALSLGHSRDWSTFNNGWQSLWRHVAAPLAVKTNTEVTHISREYHGGRLSIQVTAAGRTEEFDRLIVTTPFDSSGSLFKAEAIERDLMTAVRYVRYLVTIVEAEHCSPVSFFENATPERIGHVLYVVQAHPDASVFQIYQMLAEGMSAEQAYEYLQADLGIIGARVNKVLLQKEWRYFPHVETAALRSGYYEAWEDLQGQNGTYYFGGLLSFETVEHAANYAVYHTRRMFSDVSKSWEQGAKFMPRERTYRVT